jgi:ribonuclease HII
MALARAGFTPVAGIDEAGRGACAGPLVVAAVVLDPDRIKCIGGLADSKLLTAAAREEVYAEVLRWALDWHVVVIGNDQIDAVGLHVCNVAGMRRAFAGLRCRPGYVLTDGFPVRGLGAPALAVWKGDRVTASVAAASVVAKVSRDRMMRDLHERYPLYGFDRHKGYNTDEHERALAEHGPSPVHRYSFVNVNRAVVQADPEAPIDPVDPIDLMAAVEPADTMDLLDPVAAMTPVTVGPAGPVTEPDGCIRGEREENELMSAEDLEKYEAEMELQLYREYRDVVGLFTHVVETERRFYLTNDVELNVRSSDNGEVFFEVRMRDAWVWDMYRPARFVKNVRVVTFKDVNIEELAKADLEVPEDKPDFPA